MMKKRLYLVLIATMMCFAAFAQQNGGRQKFSPQKFDAELGQFIVNEAHLTPQEAARFFPVYREMLHKQRMLFSRQRELGKVKPADEEGCKKVIQERDAIEIELKRMQEQYHNKFFEILTPSKVYDVIKAEERFHRRKLKQWSGHKQGGER
jgi:Spy/CpxP family protein refolding chaperone